MAPGLHGTTKNTCLLVLRILRRGNLNRENVPSGWPLGKSVEHFFKLMVDVGGSDHRGRCHIRANDPGMYKQARCVSHGEQVAHGASASAPTFASLDGGLWSGNVD